MHRKAKSFSLIVFFLSSVFMEFGCQQTTEPGPITTQVTLYLSDLRLRPLVGNITVGLFDHPTVSVVTNSGGIAQFEIVRVQDSNTACSIVLSPIQSGRAFTGWRVRSCIPFTSMYQDTLMADVAPVVSRMNDYTVESFPVNLWLADSVDNDNAITEFQVIVNSGDASIEQSTGVLTVNEPSWLRIVVADTPVVTDTSNLFHVQ